MDTAIIITVVVLFCAALAAIRFCLHWLKCGFKQKSAETLERSRSPPTRALPPNAGLPEGERVERQPPPSYTASESDVETRIASIAQSQGLGTRIVVPIDLTDPAAMYTPVFPSGPPPAYRPPQENQHVVVMDDDSHLHATTKPSGMWTLHQDEPNRHEEGSHEELPVYTVGHLGTYFLKMPDVENTMTLRHVPSLASISVVELPCYEDAMAGQEQYFTAEDSDQPQKRCGEEG